MENRPLRSERWLTPRVAWVVVAAVAAVSLFAAVMLRNVRFDYDFEKFFPKNDPELDRYLAFRERFGYDNDFLLFGIERAPSVFDRSLLINVDSMAARLARLPLAREVLSPTTIEEPIVTPAGVFNTPYLRLDNDTVMRLDSARIWQDPRVRDLFFSADAGATIVLLNAEPGLSKEKSDAFMAQVQRIVDTSGITGVRIAGRIAGQAHYIDTMLKETLFFLSASMLMLSIFLWVGFRSLFGVLVPIGVVGLAILWQIGFMTMLGEPLGILTMLLPTILFVVGMSDVVHILECYLDEIRRGHPRIRAIAITYHEVGLPTFLTAVTSAIGFATLGTANIRPLQEFGFYTGIGVVLAFLLAFALLPALLVLIPPERFLPRQHRDSPWDPLLPKLFVFTMRHRRAILWTFAGIVIISLGSASRIRVNNFLLEDLPNDDPHKQGFLWFEKKFGGVRPFEMEITVADSTRSIWSPDVLRQVALVQDHVERAYGVRSIMSPVTIMRSLNKAFNGGDASFYTLPTDSGECARMARRAKLLGRDLLASMAGAEGHSARLSGRMVDEGGFVHKGKNAELDGFIASHTDPRVVQFHQTGMAWLIDRNNATLSTQLMGGMGLAVLLTALIMLWFFRDWRMVLVALLPNMVPLAFIVGVMGVFGIDLKVSTAIIFSIAFGIAEDDTIHMLAALRHHLRSGLSPAFALKRTYLGTGKAVTVTNLMLLSGFVLLVFSDFASIFYMGVLITLTLGFAYVAELFLLPALVMTIMPKKKKAVT